MLSPDPVILSLFAVVAASFPDTPTEISLNISELIARAQRGDRDAVAVLDQINAQRIFRFIVCRVPTTTDAEDLTADVFVCMVKWLPAYQDTGAPFEAWLYRIAAARVADFYRVKGRRPLTKLNETLSDDTDSPEERIEQRQPLDQLRTVLQQLPEDYQTVLILRFVERKSHEEVAEVMENSVSAVKNLQYRALSRLTELLGTERKARHYLRGGARRFASA